MNKKNLSKMYLPDNKQTLKQIGLNLNLTRESVRQIEMKALIKLRNQLITKKLKSIDQIV